MEKQKTINSEAESLNAMRVVQLFCVMAGLMLAGIAYPRGEFVLVVARPGMNEASMMRLIGSAGGSFVSGGTRSWLAVAYSDAPNFALKLMKNGALLVVDHALAAGCLERTTFNERT